MRKWIGERNGTLWKDLCVMTGSFLVMGAVFLWSPGKAAAEEAVNTPLDKDNPVLFYGDRIQYGEKSIALDENDIYLDGTLTDEQCSRYAHVYNDFKEAYNSGAIKSGTEEEPMNVWIAPDVYWMDDPDDPAIRDGINGDNTPYALIMQVNHLSLNGLTDDPDKVVFAVDRGHGAGATGNYTMFYINGTGTHTENMTFGNYCCMDLVYPLDASKNHSKRQAAVTQSQLILTNGSKITADNCNFNSRLNSCPFVGGSRILFNSCHFECTDDSLPTSAVYVGCDLDLYSPKPFYSTSGTGSVFLSCRFDVMHASSQYLTKAGGMVTIIDSTFYMPKKGQYLGWTPGPSNTLRCFESGLKVYYLAEDQGEGVYVPDEDFVMDRDFPRTNVNLDGKSARDAYVAMDGDTKIWNVYNLLKGSDDWDPLGQKEKLTALGTAAGKNYLDQPVKLTALPSSFLLKDGESRALSVSCQAFSGATSHSPKVSWTVDDALKDYLSVSGQTDKECTVKCANTTLEIAKGILTAEDESGLSAGFFIFAAPQTLAAPQFSQKPALDWTGEGAIKVSYALSYDNLEDESLVTWYRCTGQTGAGKIPVAVTSGETPLDTYTITYGDIGYYLMAEVVPRQQNTEDGTVQNAVCSRRVALADVVTDPYSMSLDFSQISCARQPEMLKGFWLSDVYKGWLEDETARTSDSAGWKYGAGAASYGSEGKYGLLPTAKGARMVYIPTAGRFGDMSLKLVVTPEKTAGQGFGSASANQYMDVYIKYDPKTLTGYALHLERKANSDCGTEAKLVRFSNGERTDISEAVANSVFNGECTITMSIAKGKFTADMSTDKEQSAKQQSAGLSHSVHLEAEVENNEAGGTGFTFTGSIPVGNRVMFDRMEVRWDKDTTTLAVPPIAVTPDNSGQEQSTEDGDKTDTGKQTDTDTGKQTNTEKETAQPPKKGTKFTVGKLIYTITDARTGKGCVTVTGGKKKNITKLIVGNTVKYKGITYRITAIGASAFKNYKKLKTADIGKNIASIGGKAFYNCSKLKKVIIRTKKLKSGKIGKKAFAGISKKSVFTVSAAKKSKLKTLLSKAGVKGKTQKIKSL